MMKTEERRRWGRRKQKIPRASESFTVNAIMDANFDGVNSVRIFTTIIRHAFSASLCRRYMLLTGGVSGFLLFLLYYIVDVTHIKRPLILFQWMGMDALMVYVLAACDLFPTIIQGFYWRSPKNNLDESNMTNGSELDCKLMTYLGKISLEGLIVPREPKAIPWTHLTPLKADADGWCHMDIRKGC